MKKNSLFVTSRLIIGALFLISSVFLAAFAVNMNVLDTNHVSTAKANRQISLLAGPERYAQLARDLGSIQQSPQSAIAAPRPDAVTPAPAANEPLGYEIFEAPGILVNVTSTSQGPAANTVEYIESRGNLLPFDSI